MNIKFSFLGSCKRRRFESSLQHHLHCFLLSVHSSTLTLLWCFCDIFCQFQKLTDISRVKCRYDSFRGRSQKSTDGHNCCLCMRTRTNSRRLEKSGRAAVTCCTGQSESRCTSSQSYAAQTLSEAWRSNVW